MHTTRRTALIALLLLPLLTSACANQGASVLAEVSCDDFAASPVKRQVTVAKGAAIVVRLCSNPSTGFQWEEAEIVPPSVMREKAREFIPPGVAMPGSAGLEQWTFEALSTGTSIVSVEYSRPWEGGEKGIWRFELEVTVA